MTLSILFSALLFLGFLAPTQASVEVIQAEVRRLLTLAPDAQPPLSWGSCSSLAAYGAEHTVLQQALWCAYRIPESQRGTAYTLRALERRYILNENAWNSVLRIIPRRSWRRTAVNVGMNTFVVGAGVMTFSGRQPERLQDAVVGIALSSFGVAGLLQAAVASGQPASPLAEYLEDALLQCTRRGWTPGRVRLHHPHYRWSEWVAEQVSFDPSWTEAEPGHSSPNCSEYFAENAEFFRDFLHAPSAIATHRTSQERVLHSAVPVLAIGRSVNAEVESPRATAPSASAIAGSMGAASLIQTAASMVPGVRPAIVLFSR